MLAGARITVPPLPGPLLRNVSRFPDLRMRMHIDGKICTVVLGLVLGLVTGASWTALRMPRPKTDSPSSQLPSPRVDQTYGKLPLAFEENLGQVDGQVRFLTRGP